MIPASPVRANVGSNEERNNIILRAGGYQAQSEGEFYSRNLINLVKIINLPSKRFLPFPAGVMGEVKEA